LLFLQLKGPVSSVYASVDEEIVNSVEKKDDTRPSGDCNTADRNHQTAVAPVPISPSFDSTETTQGYHHSAATRGSGAVILRSAYGGGNRKVKLASNRRSGKLTRRSNSAESIFLYKHLANLFHHDEAAFGVALLRRVS